MTPLLNVTTLFASCLQETLFLIDQKATTLAPPHSNFTTFRHLGLTTLLHVLFCFGKNMRNGRCRTVWPWPWVKPLYKSRHRSVAGRSCLFSSCWLFRIDLVIVSCSVVYFTLGGCGGPFRENFSCLVYDRTTDGISAHTNAHAHTWILYAWDRLRFRSETEIANISSCYIICFLLFLFFWKHIRF